MVSRAASEMPGAGAPAEIPSLPGLGTTWYRRGTRYWLRRASGAALWLVVMAFVCSMVLALYGSFRDALPPDLRAVWDRAQVAASCVAVAGGWWIQHRDHRKKLLDPPRPARPHVTSPAAPRGWLSQAASSC